MVRLETTVVLIGLICLIPFAYSQRPEPEPAAPGQFPYQISIQEYRMGQDRYVQIGSGIIIDENHVLTSTIVDGGEAAARYRVMAGITNLEAEGAQIRNLTYGVWHPDRCYVNPEMRQNNLEMLTVAEPFQFNSLVQPATLPSPWHVPTGTGTITGWLQGLPDLMHLSIPLLTFDECLTFFGKFKMRNGRICSALLKEDGTAHDADYKMDPGHPILCNDSGEEYVCGINSFTTQGVEVENEVYVGYPIVFTNIAYHLEWIRSEQRRQKNSSEMIDTHN